VVKGGFWVNLLIELIGFIEFIELVITGDWKVYATSWKVCAKRSLLSWLVLKSACIFENPRP